MDMGPPSTVILTKLILPALCWSRHRSDFYAVTTDLSVSGLRFRSSVVPGLGEMLTCSIRYAGTLEALVIHRNKAEFVARVTRADRPLPVIVRRLLDLAGEQNVDAAPQRVHPRFVPDKPDILVTTSSGVRVPGRLINVSASGAALTVNIPLEPGMRITIGRTPARVARRFEDGIGAAFLEPLSRENVGRHVSL
jgi:hypothetical protein